jgi:hypothetical protein
VEIRIIIWEKPEEDFKFKFEALIKEAAAFHPFLVSCKIFRRRNKTPFHRRSAVG